MDDPSNNPAEAESDLQASVRRQEARENLFQEKVLAIGRLHTRRALLANQVGALKSDAVIRPDRFDDKAREDLMEIEQTMRSISREITEFSPGSVEELSIFETQIEARFKAVEEGLSPLEVNDTPGPTGS